MNLMIFLYLLSHSSKSSHSKYLVVYNQVMVVITNLRLFTANRFTIRRLVIWYFDLKKQFSGV